MMWIQDLVQLVFPNLCVTCEQQLLKSEKWVCLSCLNDLPIRDEIKRMKNNPTYYQLAAHVPIHGAFCVFSFDQGGKLQTLLHHLKYKNKPEIGEILGHFAAYSLDYPTFPTNSILVPIPLHPSKIELRGYNQSEKISIGLSKVWGLDVRNDILSRTKKTETQTKKSKVERQKNVENIFKVHQMTDQPILLVDDVITTGSTLLSAAYALHNAGAKEIYVIAIASAAE